MWAGLAGYFIVAVLAGCLSFASASAAKAAFELPEGEKITDVPVIGRSIPQKEEYELYDPRIGRNFDLKNFWIRADLRVRPEYRVNGCFGGGIGTSGQCNAPGATANKIAGTANDQFVLQMTRLGIGYDLSRDVNFYFELIDSRTWGGSDPLNQACGTSPNATGGSSCTLGVRAAYMLLRNFAGVQGLGFKAGRQYVVFGNQSLFGHFDWSNTGFSFDGIMAQYSTKAWDSYFGWFRPTETDLAQAQPIGSVQPNVGGTGDALNATGDSDMLIFYNQIKSLPGFLIEPYYVYYKNNLGAADNRGQGLGTAKHSDQIRHMIGTHIEMRKGNFDASSELVYQFGQMGDTGGAANPCGSAGTQNKCLHINAWATRNWVGYTAYNMAWKPRLGFNFDYASGDGRANCTLNVAYGACTGANTFENFFPTNHIHMGYMDLQGWKNMLSFSANLQARPTRNDHIEFWYTNLNLASAQDNWYRATQGVYVFSKAGNTENHIGDELDFVWTHMFMDGKVAFQTGFSYLFTGGYIQENLGTSVNQTWTYAQLWLNF